MSRLRGALGLRGRIVATVLITTVATLVVAAVALLGPLEHSLRSAALTTLKKQVRGAPASFQNLDLRYVLQAGVNVGHSTQAKAIEAEASGESRRLHRAQLSLGQRIGATAYLIGYPDVNGRNGRILASPADADTFAQIPQNIVAKAYLSQRPQYQVLSEDGAEHAMAAIPFTPTRQDPAAVQKVRYVLAVTKPIDEITAAVEAVRTAFLTAAAAGLVLTMLLAIPLSGRLVRRLRRLRQSAVRLAEGAPSAAVPVDRVRDEVGDLSRTFALMQERLRQQEEARRAFVATASHELRTPLTSLEGMLELLEEDLTEALPDLDDARSLLSRARVQSRRLGRLAADLLDLSRIDAQVQLRSEPVELSELSRAVLAEFDLGSGERGVRSELHDAGGQVWALADPGSVARVLRILLDNAMRISPPGSEISVTLAGGERAEITVHDQGPGVPPEERALIFERFQRGRNTSGQAGFGLGLAIGRELAERMGGELVLDETSDPGATFTLRLPVAAAPGHDRLVVV